MTKEEVAQVIAYCDENKISYKQRLSELGINPCSFYDAKRKYAPKEEGENAGEFLQLIPEGSFLPNPIKPSRSRSSKQKDSVQGAVAVSIELRTPTGTMMRISGNLTGRELKEINSVIHPCLTWNVDFAIGSTASQPICERAFILCAVLFGTR